MTDEVVFLVTEEEVERGQRAIAAGDVALQHGLVGGAQRAVTVDLLLEQSQLVTYADDLPEQLGDRHLLGAMLRVTKLEHDGAVGEARRDLPELLVDRTRLRTGADYFDLRALPAMHGLGTHAQYSASACRI